MAEGGRMHVKGHRQIIRMFLLQDLYSRGAQGGRKDSHCPDDPVRFHSQSLCASGGGGQKEHPGIFLALPGLLSVKPTKHVFELQLLEQLIGFRGIISLGPGLLIVQRQVTVGLLRGGCESPVPGDAGAVY